MSQNEAEKSYLEQQITRLMQERATLPARFEQLKAQQEARIEAFLQEAGVLGRVKEMRAELEGLHRKVQSHSDILGGKIEALQAVLDTFHRVHVPPGTTFDPVSGAPVQVPEVAPVQAPAPVVPEVEPEPEYTVDFEDDEGEDFEGEDFEELEGEDGEEPEDDMAEAIENAADEETVRALLARYSKRA